jgi:hypothetical protein
MQKKTVFYSHILDDTTYRQRIFEQIKRRYLSKIWFKSNFETQIKEIAHNIRNTNSNLRIKQKKDLPTTTNKHIKPIRNINNQQMKLINTDAQYDYYIDYFQRSKNTKDKQPTQLLYISSDSLAKILGFNNTDDMIQSNSDVTNAFLDGMNKGLVKDF